MITLRGMPKHYAVKGVGTMKDRCRRLLSLLLCAVLVLSNASFVKAEGPQEQKTYDIYPVVRDITYDGTEFAVPKQVNVVFESGIDKATRNYLLEVLAENGIDARVAAKASTREFNILLGVNGTGGEEGHQKVGHGKKPPKIGTVQREPRHCEGEARGNPVDIQTAPLIDSQKIHGIATPVCALVRNDVFCFGMFYILPCPGGKVNERHGVVSCA